MSDKKDQTIIIKKIKKGGGGHHGGAWKVAYADFVTAMMAFFLLLWILSTAPQETLKGISDYFTPTIGLKDSAGIGFEGGTGKSEEGQEANDKTAKNTIVFGAPDKGPVVQINEKPLPVSETEEERSFNNVQNDLHKAINENPELKMFKDNIIIDQTPEGLRIQIVDLKDKPMFEPGTSKLMPYMEKILSKISSIIMYMPNFVSIAGHTNSAGNTSKNWLLSSERANSVREFLLSTNNIDKEQIARIVGKADQEPLDPENPEALKNIRMAITMLKASIMPYHKQSAPAEEKKE